MERSTVFYIVLYVVSPLLYSGINNVSNAVYRKLNSINPQPFPPHTSQAMVIMKKLMFGNSSDSSASDQELVES